MLMAPLGPATMCSLRHLIIGHLGPDVNIDPCLWVRGDANWLSRNELGSSWELSAQRFPAPVTSALHLEGGGSFLSKALFVGGFLLETKLLYRFFDLVRNFNLFLTFL